MSNPLEKKSSSGSLIALIFFLVAFAGGFFYVKPAWDEMGNLQKAQEEKTSQRNALNTQLTDLQKLQQELQQSSEVTRQKTLSAIPEKLEQNNILLDLGKIAKENDMTLNSINFGIPIGALAGEVARVSVTANVTGNQSALISFLRDIEGNTRKMLVKSISVQSGETETGISRVNFSVSMEAYFQGVI